MYTYKIPFIIEEDIAHYVILLLTRFQSSWAKVYIPLPVKHPKICLKKVNFFFFFATSNLVKMGELIYIITYLYIHHISVFCGSSKIAFVSNGYNCQIL